MRLYRLLCYLHALNKRAKRRVWFTKYCSHPKWVMRWRPAVGWYDQLASLKARHHSQGLALCRVYRDNRHLRHELAKARGRLALRAKSAQRLGERAKAAAG
jgi:hypothetical protein